MKSYKTKQMISVMLLVGVFMAPSLTYADPEDVAAINQLRQSNEGNFTNVISNLTPLPDIKNSTQGMLDFMNVHMKNDEHLQALLNFEAAARINEYQYNQELLFMAAPGSIWAINAGAVVGKSKVGDQALKIANKTILGSIAGFSAVESSRFTGPLVSQEPSSEVVSKANELAFPLVKDSFYSALIEPFVLRGDTTGITSLNLGQFLQTPNLNKGKISQEQGQEMIEVTLRAFPVVDAEVREALRTAKSSTSGSAISGKVTEKIVDAMVENAIVSVSINALSDIIARRTPGKDSSNNSLTESVMEAMDNYSAQRFTNPAWYAQISSSSDTALLRELAHMQAFSAWMQFQQFRVTEQQMALLATMNSVMAKMNTTMEKLNQQLALAQAQARDAQAQAEQMKAKQESCGDRQYFDGEKCVDMPSAP